MHSHIHHPFSSLNPLDQISTELLLPLERLEQRLEVAGSEAREVVSLDDFNEDGRAIHQMLRIFVSSKISSP